MRAIRLFVFSEQVGSTKYSMHTGSVTVANTNLSKSHHILNSLEGICLSVEWVLLGELINVALTNMSKIKCSAKLLNNYAASTVCSQIMVKHTNTASHQSSEPRICYWPRIRCVFLLLLRMQMTVLRCHFFCLY